MSQAPINALRQAFAACRGALIGVALLSMAANLLMLTGPMFMLQVYDRVLTSGSQPTLVALSVLVAFLFACLGLFEFLRARVMSRVSVQLEARLSPIAFRHWIGDRLSGGGAFRPLADLTALRGFLTSPVCLALFDLPWAPFFLALVFLLHPLLGLMALGGSLVVVALALANEATTKRANAESGGLDQNEQRFSDAVQRNADTVVPMGMTAAVTERWQSLRKAGIARGQDGSERSQGFAAASKSFRLLLQSAMLGLGAWLALRGEISPGTIIASSIIAGRALAPLDQVIGGWRSVVRTRQSWRRLGEHLTRARDIPTTSLPAPRGRLSVENVAKRRPGAEGGPDGVILAGINFQLEPGDALGVIGPSGGGKSSLARLLVGVWAPDVGKVRLDGAALDQWEPDELGPHIGYLPQRAEMLPGTVAQNISRFMPDAPDEAVVAAARMADVHDMILRLPEGYQTPAGDGALSGGQMQRVGLARALYGRPALVVLDEPNAHLDQAGDKALERAVRALREAGSCVIVMAHRPSALAAVNKALMLRDGRQAAFGPRDEVLSQTTAPPARMADARKRPPISHETKTPAPSGKEPSAASRPEPPRSLSVSLTATPQGGLASRATMPADKKGGDDDRT